MASSNPSREAILNRLRKAQSAGAQLGFEAPPTPAEYEAVRTVENEPASLLLQFSQALEQLRAHAHVVDDEEEAVSALMDVLRRHEADAVIGWAESELPLSNLPAVLASAGVEYHRPLGDAQRFSEAVVGISGAEALLAATGTVVVRSGAGRGRIPTVLAPVYVVLAHVDQLLPNIEAWVEKTGPSLGDRGNICFITGPSKTGDIEMILVHGVHGPGEVHVILMR